MQFQDKESVDPELIDLITFIGIESKYPVLLGTTMNKMTTKSKSKLSKNL
jgi:hypothetical protein